MGIENGPDSSFRLRRIRKEISKQHARGGVVNLTWHATNPVTEGNSWDNHDNTAVRKILTESHHHKTFITWIDNLALFFNSLKTEEGESIPVIFCPWHESNGSWFWWGAKQCTAKEYHALWCMLQDYLISEGLDNLVWSYSPNLDGNCTEQQFLERYPGDERVDIIGLDAYQWGKEEDYIRQMNGDLAMLTQYATKSGKLLALTECGMKNLPDPSWWTRILKPQMDKYPLSYFLVWRNAKHEFFGPSPGEKNALYFNEMIRNKNVLMLKDINK
jgi:beta-mannanase